MMIAKRVLIILAVTLIAVLAFGPQVASAQDGEKVHTVVDKMPEIKGGLSSFYKKVKYPKKARRKGVSGRVYLQLIVDKNGDVQNPKVIRGIGSGCDDAAIDAIKKVSFTPGKLNGEIVKVKYSLPVTFKIQK